MQSIVCLSVCIYGTWNFVLFLLSLLLPCTCIYKLTDQGALWNGSSVCPELETDYIDSSWGCISITAFLKTLDTDRKGWIIVMALQTLRQSPKKFLSTSWEFSLHFHIKTPIGSELIFFLFYWMVLSRQTVLMLMKLCMCEHGAFRSCRSVVSFPRFDWPV